MIRIGQIKLDYHLGKQALWEAAAKKLHLTVGQLQNLTVVRRSIDARKGDIYFVYTVDVAVKNETSILKKLKGKKDISPAIPVVYHFPEPGTKKLVHPPIIIGSGPAGLFAGLMLARQGYRPIILERGCDVHRRMEIVEKFWKDGQLNPDCNVQFGEGGAGTFSDGKLNTLIKDRSGRNRQVLECFVQAGAPEEILYVNKPHIGTDILVRVVENIRNEIIRLGGQVLFEHTMTDLVIEDSQIKGVLVNHKSLMKTENVILAIGHSARDTFEMLLNHMVPMVPKPFAVGVRIEHPQNMIDCAQYGRESDHLLTAADYKLTHQCSNGRGVYTFCMCPGGYVVNASSEPEHLAVNGMSYSGRSSKNANSAVIVTVTPEDFGGKNPLCGVEFQRRLEQACYKAGKGSVPVQLFKDFKNNQVSHGYGDIIPVHKGSVAFGNIRDCLPPSVCDSIIEGITAFGTKIRGFDREDALLSGVESRTSSPVKIIRDENWQSTIRGLYPCGEGAGYAGGITSAAMDGIKVAEAIASVYAPFTDKDFL